MCIHINKVIIFIAKCSKKKKKTINIHRNFLFEKLNSQILHDLLLLIHHNGLVAKPIVIFMFNNKNV